MWTCKNCDEKHEDAFEVCWKCGFTVEGVLDPSFKVTEPVSEDADQEEVVTEELELPSLELPDLTYYAIPVVFWISLIYEVLRFKQFDPQQLIVDPFSSFSIADVVVYLLMLIFVGIPVIRVLARAIFQMIKYKQYTSHRNQFAESLWLLSMFRLPDSIRNKHHWFPAVYYGSIVAMIILQPILTVISMQRVLP